MDDIRQTRLAGVLRDIARGGIAGLAAGIVVGGVGGRLAMTIAALLNRDAFGARTESDQIVGVFSIDGTILLLFFGGMFAGMLAAVVWVVISPWVPWRGPRRWLVAMPIAAALGAFGLIESTNIDFRILGSDELILIVLVVLVGLIGGATAWLDERLEGVLPGAHSASGRIALVYGTVAVLGLIPLAFTLTGYFSEGFSTGPTPPGVGLALLVVGMTTVVLWVRRVATGRTAPSPALLVVGRIGLAAAVVLGTLHVASEVGKILAV